MGAGERVVGGGRVRRLTPRQARFVDEYVVDLNAKQAAVRAGYSTKTAAQQGSHLLKLPLVAAAVAERQAARAARCEVDAAWVLSQLREVALRCLQAVPLLDRSGRETGEWRFNASGANRALELIGKHLGMFGERLDVQLLRSEAQQIAAELGLDEREVLEEADRWLRSLKRGV
jgi:phage terminase small subunit